jgi:WD40 repeat protein
VWPLLVQPPNMGNLQGRREEATHFWPSPSGVRGYVKLATYLPSPPPDATAPAHPRVVIVRNDGHAAEVRCSGTGRRVGKLAGKDHQRVAVLDLQSGGSIKPCIVTGSADGSVRAWDGDSLALLYTARGDPQQVMSLFTYYEPGEGRPRIVSGHQRGGLQVWDGQAGTLLHSIKGFEVSILVLSGYLWEDGDGVLRQRLVVGGGIGKVAVCDPERGEVLQELNKSSYGWVRAVACFDPSRQPHVASVADDGLVKVWEAEEGRLVHDLTGRVNGSSSGRGDGHVQRVQSVCAYEEHVGGRPRLVTASEDRAIKVWDAQSGTLVHDLTHDGMRTGVLAAYQTAEGPWRVVSGFSDRSLKIWDPEAARLLHTLQGHRGGVDLLHVFELPDGRCLLASADNSGDVRLWDLFGDRAPVRSGEGGLLRSGAKTG